ncbi:hypothetical protein [Leucobacter sp. 1207-22]|uniref:hypothetical protein n=1 Tax=Leucobacter sp. 1207-22 TaxID=2604456 RepID=UPI004063FF4B
MSEQERPLTRRELRAREEAERAQNGAANSQPAEPAALTIDEPAAEAVRVSEEVLESIDISPVHEDGTPRSRREMRQLREEAAAAMQDEGASGPFTTEVIAPAVEAVESGASVSEAEIAAPGAADLFAEEPPLDDSAFPATAAYTFDELKQAEEPSATPAAAVVDEPQDVPVEAEAEQAEVADDIDAEGKSKRGFGALWRRGKKSEDADAAEAEALEETDIPDAELNVDTQAPEVVEEVETVSAVREEAPAPVEAAEDLPVATAEPVVSEPVAEVAEPVESEAPAYTFPDIRPPEEWHPVIDDPASRIGGSAASQADFESLISRAVAQEGAASPSNTSALILPSHPEDTDSLTGPLGMTGELFVTGAIHLPKSLGETGSHASLQHSAEFDPFTAEAAQDPLNATADHGVAPVSARAAVSAQVVSETPVVAAPTREKSKLPMILALSGGGLVVVVGGIIVWAVNSGAF